MNEQAPLSVLLEGILFAHGEPLSIKELSRIIGSEPSLIEEALGELGIALQGRGLTLLRTDTGVSLHTSPLVSGQVTKLLADDEPKELGKAALETLAIVLYEGPVAKSQIEHIRGVNATTILRSLLVRDLVERIPNPQDSRTYLYSATPKLLAHLGVSNKEQLPDFETAKTELHSFTNQKEESPEKEQILEDLAADTEFGGDE